MRNKYEIALEVLKELIAENEENKNSEHYSVRYSSEQKGIQLDVIASEIRDKICNYKAPKENYYVMDFDDYTELVLFLRKNKIRKENVLGITHDSKYRKITLLFWDVEE